MKHWLALAAVFLGACGTNRSEQVITPPEEVGSQTAPLWSAGNADAANASTGWRKVNSSSALVPPALAAFDGFSGDVHLVDLSGTKVRHQVWSKNDGWGAAALLSIPGSPAAGAGPGLVQRAGAALVDLVVRGSDQYYHRYFTGGVWNASWEPIGGWGGDVSLTSTMVNGSAVLDVWVTGDGAVWRRRWQNPSWLAWEQIGFPQGKTLLTAPGVTSRSDGTIDIVAGASPDGQLYHSHFTPAGTFGGWESITGKTLTKPALSSPASTRLDVWVKGASDGLVYHSFWSLNANPQWSGLETSINTAPGTATSLGTGVAALQAGGLTTIASVSTANKLVARSWVDPVAPAAASTPTAIVTSTKVAGLAENSVLVVPPNPNSSIAQCKLGNVYISRGAEMDLLRVNNYSCAISGTGKQTGAEGSCPATQQAVPNNGNSNDSQIVKLSDGRLLWVFQNGGVSAPLVQGCDQTPVTRGTETIRASSDCGATWTVAKQLDPCVSGSPFDTSKTCNTNSTTGGSCPKGAPPTGMDRPEIMASMFDDSVYMGVMVVGTVLQELHLLRSHSSNLASWEDIDVGPSGGPLSFAETATHIYFARAEFGVAAANLGLYRIARSAAFTAANVEFLGNMADQEVAGIVQLALTTDALGDLAFRWAFPASGSNSIRRGFSKLSPGGVVELVSDVYTPGTSTIKLPTFVSNTSVSGRTLLYWYERNSAGNSAVKASISDGIGRWSPPMVLAGPWQNWGSFDGLADYLKGSYIPTTDTFFALWLQPDATFGNRLGMASVH